jgi:hypothetical protein
MVPSNAAEIRDRARAVLECMERLRGSGGGCLPMDEMFELFGAPEDPAVRASLEARGAIVVQLSTPDEATFENTGPAFSAPIGPGKLKVPKRIAGTVVWNEQGVEFEFDPNQTMTGKVFFIELKVLRVEVSEHHVAVRFPNAVFDQEWKF